MIPEKTWIVAHPEPDNLEHEHHMHVHPHAAELIKHSEMEAATEHAQQFDGSDWTAVLQYRPDLVQIRDQVVVLQQLTK